jgi:4-hydroxybenzoate polyprenyltransferase
VIIIAMVLMFAVAGITGWWIPGAVFIGVLAVTSYILGKVDRKEVNGKRNKGINE